MKFRADEIASVIQNEIEQYSAQVDVREVGRVLESVNPDELGAQVIQLEQG